MNLQSKFTLYNTLSKAVIILVFVLVMPMLIKEVSLINTDNDLEEKKEQVLAIINDVGISSFIEEGSDGSYGSYNLLKEEFISLEQTDSIHQIKAIEDSPREVEGEVVNYRVLSYTFPIADRYYVLEVGRSLFTVQEIESSLRKLALLTLLIISLVTTLSDIAFTKILLKPLNKIVIKLQNTKDPFSFSFQSINTNTSDFKYLDESILDMMKRLQDVFFKEREFISNVSHELLTPVSILQSKLENMLHEEILPEDAEIRLLESQKTLSRLKTLIRSLLLMSKIENLQYLKHDEVYIGNLINEVVEEIEDRLAAKEIKLIKNSIEDYCFTSCNKSLLHTLFFNLINNGIKYNRSGGSIYLIGFWESSEYRFQIKDTGIGIAPENIPFIFNRFKRFQKSDDESFGLGLPIVKTIADFHGIKIQVTSTPEEGSTFTLILEKS